VGNGLACPIYRRQRAPCTRLRLNLFSRNTLLRRCRQLINLAPLLPLPQAHKGEKAFMDSALTTLEPRLGRSVSIEQAATLLNVSRRTIYNRIREGRLITIRTIGGSQRVLVESLVELGFRPQAFSAAAAQMAFVARPLSR
jgi:excisionase family DNA binding protein